MTELSAALAYRPESGRFDECLTPDGSVRPGWEPVVEALAGLGPDGLDRVAGEASRLLAEDGVSYAPPQVAPGDRSRRDEGEPALTASLPWRLDPVPFALDAGEWRDLEAGLTQRTQLLSAVLGDVYTSQRLLATGELPPELVYGHAGYLRPLTGVSLDQRLFAAAVDLGRDADGTWVVLADRTDVLAGAGYAMQNRRVVSRVLPGLYRRARLVRLTPFFQAMRVALLDAAPRPVEDPRVVVLTPGTDTTTAFDQAFLASLLGFPLVEGRDLTVRDGRLWMRTVGREEQVDVVLRRVGAVDADPLELRPDTQGGVAGLTEAVRRDAVSVVNGLGSGVAENPGLAAFLPRLCRVLLGEELRLRSSQAWWCGDPASLDHVVTRLDDLVVRPISGPGRWVGAELDAAERQDLVDRIRARPYRFVGQQAGAWSSVPSLQDPPGRPGTMVPAPVTIRAFAVRQGVGYAVMPGGLATVTDTVSGPASRSGSGPFDDAGGPVTDPLAAPLTKDVWVLSRQPEPLAEPAGPQHVSVLSVAGAQPPPMSLVPRVLDDLFWLGRYAERVEDVARLLLAVRQVMVETDLDLAPDSALPLLLTACTHVSGTYPGFAGERQPDPLPELRSVVLDTDRRGSMARGLAALAHAAQGVRDQLSDDVWVVLAGIDRGVVALRVARLDQGSQLADTCERVLSGLLALTGITAENMTRDAGWHLLDIGRGLERATQVLSLLRYTVAPVRRPQVEAMVMEAALSAAESAVTFRRRHPRIGRAAVLELLMLDPTNPRSVAYQLNRIDVRLRALPDGGEGTKALRVLSALQRRLADTDLDALLAVDADDTGLRRELDEHLGALRDQVARLARAVEQQYLRRPPAPQPMILQLEGRR